mgnify:CR=1 FL=1
MRRSAASSSAASKAKSSEAKSGKALTVRMLDIGQGDACLLEKDGKFVLIDSGDIEHRDTIVVAAQKVSREESLQGRDHASACRSSGRDAGIFKNFKVEAIYDDGMPAGTASYKNYLKAIKANQIPYKALKAGDELPSSMASATRCSGRSRSSRTRREIRTSITIPSSAGSLMAISP